MTRVKVLLCLSLLTAAAPPATSAQESIAPHAPYVETAETLERWIASEMDAKSIPGLSIALVDDQRIVWARGFGLADPQGRRTATAETVYRVGSISKLFTDVAVMQLVEQGKLDLDAPVRDVLPEFAPGRPDGDGDGAKPITLRQLMAHRSGLVRESPNGNYFDPTEPTLAATVKSLNETTLVYAPEQKTKYSNAGIAVVGLALERAAGQPFSQAIEQRLLAPLRLERTRFEPTAAIRPLLAAGRMTTFDGRPFPAPTFALGTAPAGNLYSNVLDLGRFLSVLFADGRGPDGPVLKPDTLRRMLEPQFAAKPNQGEFGLGFALGKLDGRRRIGHGGAIYGFSTEVAALPAEKLGVVAIANLDCANAVTKRIADTALRVMLAAREHKPVPTLATTSPLGPELSRRVEGRYEGRGRAVDLLDRDGRLYLTAAEGGSRSEVRRTSENRFVVDDRLAHGSKVEFKDDQLLLDGASLHRVAAARPAPPPERWAGLIGEYGWDHNVLYIYEKDGKLHALIEWFFAYPLEEVAPDRFRFPDRGLYEGETLTFRRDEHGRAREVTAAEVLFKRRPIEGEDGATFRIEPLKPIAELRAAALAAKPPIEKGEFRAPDLVDVTTVEPTIKLEIRYATDNNFMGTPLYSSARSFMQRPVAEALKRVHQGLKPQGYGLLIHDSYRPWHVTKMFWDATPGPSKIFVANPAKGSRHNRGSAIDLTLYDLASGRPVPMVGGYDEFSSRSYPDYPGGTSRQRWHRELLRRAMEAEGFTVNVNEWWHFDHEDWNKYPILNITFEELDQAKSTPTP